MRPDWFYCTADGKDCVKAREFFDRHDLSPTVVVDAKKFRFGRLEAFRLAKLVDSVYAIRVPFVVFLNLKITKPDVEALARFLLSAGGAMRAPVMRSGRSLVVGFDEELYREVLNVESSAQSAETSGSAG